MRNALVLVPLCIGLSSGFIVTSSTSEVYAFTKTMFVSKREANIPLDESNSKNKSNNSASTETSLLYDDVEGKIKKEIYNQGLEEDKSINERSFVFVNQRWKKIPTKTHLVDTKPGSPYLNKSSVLNVFEETVNKVAAKKGNINSKYFDERVKGNNMSKTKNYFPVMYQHKEIMGTNSDINYRRENVPIKPANKNNKGINSNGKQNSIINDYIKINKQSNDDRSYFKTITKANNVVKPHNVYKDKPTDIFKSKYYDRAPFKFSIHDLINDVNENSFSEYNLFQHTLEEQVPDEQLQRYKDYELNYVKYCLECSQNANMRKLNSRIDMECKCRCGRFIHLRGLPHT